MGFTFYSWCFRTFQNSRASNGLQLLLLLLQNFSESQGQQWASPFTLAVIEHFRIPRVAMGFIFYSYCDRTFQNPQGCNGLHLLLLLLQNVLESLVQQLASPLTIAVIEQFKIPRVAMGFAFQSYFHGTFQNPRSSFCQRTFQNPQSSNGLHL